jgi:hypothetical protein
VRVLSLPLVRELAIGAGAGLLVLGAGGRVAMRLIALREGTPTGVTVGGTLTVVVLGLVSGVAGALLLALSDAAAGRLTRRRPGARPWTRRALFAALLLLVTLRGLRGSPPIGLPMFLPLVVLYGVALDRLVGRRRRGEPR